MGGPFSEWAGWERGSSSGICLLGLERICDEVGFQNDFSTGTKTLFLLLEVVFDIEDSLCNLLNMQMLPPALGSSVPPPTFLKPVLGTCCVEPFG